MAAGALGAAVVGAGAGVEADEAKPGGGWKVTLSPYLWAAGVSGDTTTRGVEAEVDESFDDVVDNLEFGGMLLAGARKDRFGIVVNGFFVRTEDESHSGRLDLDARSDSASLGAAAYYRVLEWRLGATAGGGPITLGIAPLAGARLNYGRLEVRSELDALGRTFDRQADRSEVWVDPTVGSLVELRLSDRWSVTVEGDIGGFGVGSNFTWNAQGLVGYRVALGRFDTVLGAGYRAFHYDYHSGGFEADILQQGPLLGAAIQF